ncbi:hypothetical protein QR77_24240 [Streptomyces sp. 150FB]|uniref:hypothetical protein n=1 Tax=Streptomyces sp. 150FB TaxID=1576605 RepID=UPI0005893943|nr:hypothetical protein [Streptomyces sp. 150FB]KIF76153.1 hypothetical protein QR77_24240 [Streptomyces sp. 150FB]
MDYHEEVRAAFRRGETDVVMRLSTVELDRALTAGDQAAEVDALCMLARAAVRGEDLDEARRLATAARVVVRGAGDGRLDMGPLHILAACARMAGDLEAARTLYGESIALDESLDETRMALVDRHNLAYVELHSGHPDTARELFTGTHRQALRLGYDEMVPFMTLGAAVLAAADGDDARAARLLGAADSAFGALDRIPDPDDALERETLRERLLTALGRGPFDAAYAEGAGLDARGALEG